jgi:hypothetical protein
MTSALEPGSGGLEEADRTLLTVPEDEMAKRGPVEHRPKEFDSWSS